VVYAWSHALAAANLTGGAIIVRWRGHRSHHCRICNRCIVRMDHHCPWMNNCVGANNQKHFMLFLFYTIVEWCVTLWYPPPCLPGLEPGSLSTLAAPPPYATSNRVARATCELMRPFSALAAPACLPACTRWRS
jgi:hypothetical protein